MTYKTTVIAIAVHQQGVNPIFGEGVTHIKLCDDAAGYFIEVSQADDTTENGVVRFDPAEWDTINAAVKSLLNSAPVEDKYAGIVG
jgi:hypothetical protein